MLTFAAIIFVFCCNCCVSRNRTKLFLLLYMEPNLTTQVTYIISVEFVRYWEGCIAFCCVISVIFVFLHHGNLNTNSQRRINIYILSPITYITQKLHNLQSGVTLILKLIKELVYDKRCNSLEVWLRERGYSNKFVRPRILVSITKQTFFTIKKMLETIMSWCSALPI